jgi:hypothetical protein
MIIRSRSVILFCGALAVAAASFSCAPYKPENPLPTGPLGDTDPVAAIIERSPELQLADSQIAMLRLVKHDLGRANQPIVRELEQLGMLRQAEGMRRRPEEPTAEQKERAKPLIEQLKQNNEKAREAALEFLTDAQKARLDTLEKLSRRRGQDGRRPRSSS